MFENGTIGLFAKAIASAAAAAAMTALNAMANGDVATDEWVTIIVTFVVGLGALAAIPVFPEGWKRYLKAFISAVVAGSGVLTVALLAGSPFGVVLVLKIVLAVLAAWGITYTVPDAAESDPIDPVTHRYRPVRGKQRAVYARHAVAETPPVNP